MWKKRNIKSNIKTVNQKKNNFARKKDGQLDLKFFFHLTFAHGRISSQSLWVFILLSNKTKSSMENSDESSCSLFLSLLFILYIFISFLAYQFLDLFVCFTCCLNLSYFECKKIHWNVFGRSCSIACLHA